jgi:large subunit ribosomal protein L24
MKATKIRNQQIYRAPYAIRSNHASSPLSRELKKKYGRKSVRVQVDDSVKVIRGEYKGIDGKVTKVSTMKNSIAIEGIKREKLKGEKIDVYIPASNILVTSLNTSDHWRKSKLEGNKPKSTPREAKPEQPKVAKPEQPKVAKPEQPKVAKPEQPKVAKPEQPKVAKPEPSKEVKPEKKKLKTKKETKN